MTYLKIIWRWLKNYWYIPLLAVGVVLLTIITGRNQTGRVVGELRAIGAKERTRKIEAERGREAALRDVNARYKARHRRLNLEGQARADQLRNDPVRRAAFYERVARGK